MEQQKSFRTIYDETRNAMLRFLIPRIRSSEDVEDVMQEVYRNLYRRMEKSGAPDDPMRYLYGIARHELARFYRKRAQKRERETPLTETLEDDAPQPDERLFLRERASTVWEIVKSEPLLSYQAFTLYYGFDETTSAIAQKLGVTEETVRKRISRTRKRIREALAEREDLFMDPSEPPERRTK